MTTPADASSGHKPALRGVQHQWAAVVAAIAGVYLVTTAPNQVSQVAVAIYSASLVLLLAVSAIYHRFDWPHRTRMWLRRADHASIFLLIGGTLPWIAPVSPGSNDLMPIEHPEARHRRSHSP